MRRAQQIYDDIEADVEGAAADMEGDFEDLSEGLDGWLKAKRRGE